MPLCLINSEIGDIMELKEKEHPKLLVRQVIVVTTISENGIANAAPFSLSSPISFDPALFGFSCNPKHDTWQNIQKTKDFVVNVVSEDFGPLMKILETDYDYEVNEIEKAGLTEEKSKKVKSPRIKEANAWIECSFEDSVKLGDHIWVVGKVCCAEVKDELWDNVLDLDRARNLCHIGGKFFAGDIKIKEYERA